MHLHFQIFECGSCYYIALDIPQHILHYYVLPVHDEIAQQENNQDEIYHFSSDYLVLLHGFDESLFLIQHQY